MKITDVRAVYPRYQHVVPSWRTHFWHIVVRVEIYSVMAGLGYGGGGVVSTGDYDMPRMKEWPMNDQQLIRTLRSVGMEVFETFYNQFADESLTNQQVVALIREQRNYTEQSYRSRVGHARMIIRAGRGPDALILCARRTR